jgi:hypothetical protein
MKTRIFQLSLALLLASAVAAFAQQKAPQPSPQDDPEEAPQSRALGQRCEANYALDNAGTIVTGWIDLGQVSWPNRRQKCKNLAIANCAYAKQKLLVYAPVGSANMQSICNQGRLCVYFDTRVGGLKYTRDGNCCTPITCTRPPCPWTGYDFVP